MDNRSKINDYIAAGIALVAFVWIYATVGIGTFSTEFPAENESSTTEPVLLGATNVLSYICDDDRQVTSIVEMSSDKPGKALLYLDDGRNFLLEQTISASGVRYATENEDLVFWTKGDTAFIDENGIRTFENCIVSQ